MPSVAQGGQGSLDDDEEEVVEVEVSTLLL
jgi:hypothetical protein